MQSGSLRTRGINFAYLFGPPRFIDRSEAYKIHEAICRELSLDDLSFIYQSPESQDSPQGRASAMKFVRKHGRGGLTFQIDNPGRSSPIRLLLVDEWPTALEVTKQSFEVTAKAVFESLTGKWQRVMAEVRIRAQCSAPSGESALSILRENILTLPNDWETAIGGSLAFAGAKFEVQAGHHDEDPLANPKRVLSVEVLREDRQSLYLELMCQWPQIPEAISPESITADALTRIRPIESNPGEYIDFAYECLQRCIGSLSQKREGKQ